MRDFIPTEKTGKAIQTAIDAANQAGGGRVVLEPGIYHSGTIYLKSNVELHIPAGSQILGFDNPEKYDDVTDPALVNISPEGSEAYADRSASFPYKIDENDLAYKLFKEHGFTWGGNWNSTKDYQHFERPN